MQQSSAVDTLNQHGKSFRFAGIFLSKDQLHQAARLYQFCRWIDDIGDEATDKAEARRELLAIKHGILSGTSKYPLLQDFLELKHQLHMPDSQPIHLIDGVMSDMSDVAFTRVDELIQYAYRVAGVVGLMMCPILGAEKMGHVYAIDLGIGMQLTNIARDVREDALMGRRYLPAQWCDLTAEQIANDNTRPTQTQVKGAISKLLELAEVYYASARIGYRYLPKRSRRAISIAANVYRQIGIKIQQNDYAYLRGRTVVSKTSKILIALQTIVTPDNKKPLSHDDSLHRALNTIDFSRAK